MVYEKEVAQDMRENLASLSDLYKESLLCHRWKRNKKIDDQILDNYSDFLSSKDYLLKYLRKKKHVRNYKTILSQKCNAIQKNLENIVNLTIPV